MNRGWMAHPHDQACVPRGLWLFPKLWDLWCTIKQADFLLTTVFFLIFFFPKSRKANTRHGEEKQGPIKPLDFGNRQRIRQVSNIGSSEISLSHLHNVVSGRPGPYLKTVSTPKGRKLKLIYHASCYKCFSRKQKQLELPLWRANEG